MSRAVRAGVARIARTAAVNAYAQEQPKPYHRA